MSERNQLLDNTDFMGDFKSLVKEEYDIIKKIVEIVNESIAVPCTACDYCVIG